MPHNCRAATATHVICRKQTPNCVVTWQHMMCERDSDMPSTQEGLSACASHFSQCEGMSLVRCPAGCPTVPQDCSITNTVSSFLLS